MLNMWSTWCVLGASVQAMTSFRNLDDTVPAMAKLNDAEIKALDA